MRGFLHIGSLLALTLALPAFAGARGSSETLTNSSLLFADLDGDHRADAISVELDALSRANALYSVNLKLSTGSRETIALNVPRWGIELAARDIDGDHDVDLVISNIFTHEALQVYVNLGGGVFAPADPDSFNTVLWGEGSSIASGPALPPLCAADEDGRSTPFTFGIVPAATGLPFAGEPGKPRDGTGLVRTPFCGSPRAPPSTL